MIHVPSIYDQSMVYLRFIYDQSTIYVLCKTNLTCVAWSAPPAESIRHFLDNHRHDHALYHLPGIRDISMTYLWFIHELSTIYDLRRISLVSHLVTLRQSTRVAVLDSHRHDHALYRLPTVRSTMNLTRVACRGPQAEYTRCYPR